MVWTACKAARRAGAAAPVNAGAFGYHLHRQLVALGVRNLVVQPQDWDERGKGVKTDRIDARALPQRRGSVNVLRFFSASESLPFPHGTASPDSICGCDLPLHGAG